MNWVSQIATLEVAKLAVPALTAVAAAFIAVWLALGRYKRERKWDRQLTAYTDVCVAMGEIRTVVGMWADNIENGRKFDKEWQTFQRNRYRDARRNLSVAVAVSALILPVETRTLLAKLDRELERDDDDPWDRYNHEYSLIDDALVELAAQGRKALGFRD